MGKRKPVQTNSKVDASPLNLAVNKGQIKELLVKELLNSQGKGSIPKDGGSKLKAKSLKSEIDDIFSVGKKKSQEASEAGTRAAVEAAGQDPDTAASGTGPVKRPRVEGSKDDIFGAVVGKGRKRTEEGYAIYTEDELGFGKKGGETDLCPFDCECCF